MRPTDLQTTHDLMACPACARAITANVTVTPTLSEPTLAEGGGKVNIDVSAKVTRFSVEHRCPGLVEARDPEPPSEPTP